MRPGVEAILSTISVNGFRTFCPVFELTSQNCDPCRAASASPSVAVTLPSVLEAGRLSSWLPTKYVTAPGARFSFARTSS